MAFLNILKLTAKLNKKPPTCSAVIAAAGDSQRCKGEDKLLYKIRGKPVLAYTVEAFQNCERINEIIIVAKTSIFEQITDICLNYGFTKVAKVIVGGETRTNSVFNGVFATSPKANLIAIHDGARPCIDTKLITKTIHTAAKYHAAAPGIRVTSTLKKEKIGTTKNMGIVISETVDRQGLFEIQTPQIFRAEIIKAALTNVINKSITLTDDCLAAEIIGVSVHIVESTRSNIKITEPDDLKIAEALLK